MFYGALMQFVVFSGIPAIHAGLVVVLFTNQDSGDDPNAPSIWEAVLPVWGIGMLLLIGLFALSLVFTLPDKRRIKRLLLPIRCQRCPVCFYDLSARPRDDDTCPECGVIAPRRECVRLWCKLLRSRF